MSQWQFQYFFSFCLTEKCADLTALYPAPITTMCFLNPHSKTTRNLFKNQSDTMRNALYAYGLFSILIQYNFVIYVLMFLSIISIIVRLVIQSIFDLVVNNFMFYQKGEHTEAATVSSASLATLDSADAGACRRRRIEAWSSSISENVCDPRYEFSDTLKVSKLVKKYVNILYFKQPLMLKYTGYVFLIIGRSWRQFVCYTISPAKQISGSFRNSWYQQALYL